MLATPIVRGDLITRDGWCHELFAAWAELTCRARCGVRGSGAMQTNATRPEIRLTGFLVRL